MTSVNRPERSDGVNGLVVEENLALEQLSVEEALKHLRSAIRTKRQPLVARLSAVLLNALSVNNCVVIYRLASRHALLDLETASRHVICKNFLRISETNEEFIKLTYVALTHIVYSDTVHATEQQIFRAAVRWVMADLPRRRISFKNLLPAVRVNRCPLTPLEEMVKHFLVKTQRSFMETAEHRIQCLTSGRLGRDLFATDAASRVGVRNVIFVMGGTKDVNTMETLDPVRRTWVSHNVPDAPGGCTWLFSLGYRILVLQELRNMWTLRCFSVRNMKWTNTCMKSPPNYRHGSCKAHFDRHVYIIGGDDPYKNRCDKYDADTNKWEEMAPMNDGRNEGAAACFEGKLYCCGGRDRLEEGVRNSLEVLDLRPGGRWANLPSMEMRRFQHVLVSCGRQLWAIGGLHDEVRVSAVERYDVDERKWTFVPSFINIRERISVCVLDRHIYVIGGEFEDTVPDRKVDVYDVENVEWTDGGFLNVERSFHGSCVIQSLSDADAEQYAVPIR